MKKEIKIQEKELTEMDLSNISDVEPKYWL